MKNCNFSFLVYLNPLCSFLPFGIKRRCPVLDGNRGLIMTHEHFSLLDGTISVNPLIVTGGKKHACLRQRGLALPTPRNGLPGRSQSNDHSGQIVPPTHEG